MVCLLSFADVVRSDGKWTDFLLLVSLPAILRTPRNGRFFFVTLSVSSESASVVVVVDVGATVAMLPVRSVGSWVVAERFLSKVGSGLTVGVGRAVVAVFVGIAAVMSVGGAGAELVDEGPAAAGMLFETAELVAVAPAGGEVSDVPAVVTGAALAGSPDLVVAAAGKEVLARGLFGVTVLPRVGCLTPPMLAAFSGLAEMSSSEAVVNALFLGVNGVCGGAAEWDEDVRNNLGLPLVLLTGLALGLPLVLLSGLDLGLGERGDAGIEGRPGDRMGDGDLEESLVCKGKTDLPLEPVLRTGEGEPDLGDLDLERSRVEAGGILGVGANRFLLARRVAGVRRVGSM